MKEKVGLRHDGHRTIHGSYRPCVLANLPVDHDVDDPCCQRGQDEMAQRQQDVVKRRAGEDANAVGEAFRARAPYLPTRLRQEGEHQRVHPQRCNEPQDLSSGHKVIATKLA